MKIELSDAQTLCLLEALDSYTATLKGAEKNAHDPNLGEQENIKLSEANGLSEYLFGIRNNCPRRPQPGEARHDSTSREDILKAAQACVCGDREQDYGSPEKNFETIANLWNAYLDARPSNVIVPHDVAAMLALLKVARIASGHAKKDNWVDLAGYAACGGEIEAKTEG